MRETFQHFTWDWSDDTSPDDCWNLIKDRIIQSMEECIPKVEVKYMGRKKPPWLSFLVKKSVKKKYNLYQKFLRTRTGQDYLLYCKIRNECCKIIKASKREFETLHLTVKIIPNNSGNTYNPKLKKVLVSAL